jgi:hypothetical protein
VALREARRAGADAQRIALELAFAHLARGETIAARDQLDLAAHGADPELAATARTQLRYLPRAWWADVYADSFAWYRRSRDAIAMVPTARIRGFRRLSFAPEAYAYAFGQITRELGADGAGLDVPTLYADNYALAGGGVLLRLVQRRAGLFAQIGPALALFDTAEHVQLDARAGGVLWLESIAGAFASQLYAEVVYTSRFDHDVQALARWRGSIAYATTGALRWELFGELRGALDRRGDYFDNLVDAGAGPRWRLRSAVPLDILVGAHAGRYLGREAMDPLPSRTSYVDLRILFATYVEL